MKTIKYLALAGLVLGLSAAQAQVYRCQQGDRWVYSDRPCDNGRSKLGGTGPVPDREAAYRMRSQPLTAPTRAPDYLSRMSPHCASLNDAMRTARSRGTHESTLDELRRNYEHECRDDESRAQRELSNERAAQRKGQAEQERRQQAEAQREALHCTNLRDVIRARAREAAASDALLARHRQSYAERCEKRG